MGNVVFTCLLVLGMATMVQAANVTLAWDASVSQSVTGYKLHRCTETACQPVLLRDVGNTLTTAEMNLSPGLYRWGVSAYDAEANGSSLSNIVEWQVAQAPSGCTTEGLVGRWDFDDGPGSTTAQDTSGQGNLATLTNMDPATDWVVRSGGYALDFDGVNDHVATAYIGTPVQTTWAAWAYPRTYGQNNIGGVFKKLGVGDVAVEADGPGAFDRSWSLIRHFSTGTGFWGTPTNTVQLNMWQHVAVVYDSASVVNAPLIYIDGVPQTVVKEGSHSGSAVVNNNPWLIGLGFGDNSAFDGMLDEVHIYSRLLTQEEVQCLANIGQPPAAPGVTTVNFGVQ